MDDAFLSRPTVLWGVRVMNPTPAYPPLFPSVALLTREVILVLPLSLRNPTNIPRAVSSVFNPWKEKVHEQIHIGDDSDEVLAQMGKDRHERHCILA